jgi:acyl carrier protein
VTPTQPQEGGASGSSESVSADRVALLVRDSVGVEVTDRAADLLSSGIIDSLSFVTLLLAIEREFGISIDLERMDLDDVRSIARIAAFVDRELDARTESGMDRQP